MSIGKMSYYRLKLTLVRSKLFSSTQPQTYSSAPPAIVELRQEARENNLSQHVSLADFLKISIMWNTSRTVVYNFNLSPRRGGGAKVRSIG